MTALAQHTLSRDEARSLTDEVKHDAERLWRKLVELHEGGAHEVLGYSSWGTYFKSEFGGSERHGYRLLDSGRVLDALGASDQLVTPKNEAQARELAPLLDKPEQLREAWAEASANGGPTAKQVREIVRRRFPIDAATTEAERREAADKQLRWAATMNVLTGLGHFDRDAVEEQAERVAALIDESVAAAHGETITPDRLRRAAAWAALLADALERTHDA